MQGSLTGGTLISSAIDQSLWGFALICVTGLPDRMWYNCSFDDDLRRKPRNSTSTRMVSDESRLSGGQVADGRVRSDTGRRRRVKV